MMKHGQGSWPGSLRRPGVSARGSAVLRAAPYSRFLGEQTLEISGGAPRPGGERDRPSRWPGGQQSGARARADAHDALGTGTGAAGSKCMRDHIIERERARASARDGGGGGGKRLPLGARRVLARAARRASNAVPSIIISRARLV